MKIERITYRGEYLVVEASLRVEPGGHGSVVETMKKLQAMVRKVERTDDRSEVARELDCLAGNLENVSNVEIAKRLRDLAGEMRGDNDIPF